MVPNSTNSPAMGSFSIAKQGFKRAENKLNEAALHIANGDITGSRMVELIESKHLYAATAQIVKTQDEMLGTLLDVRR